MVESQDRISALIKEAPESYLVPSSMGGPTEKSPSLNLMLSLPAPPPPSRTVRKKSLDYKLPSL